MLTTGTGRFRCRRAQRPPPRSSRRCRYRFCRNPQGLRASFPLATSSIAALMLLHCGKLPVSLMGINRGCTLRSIGPYSAYQRFMAIKLERKRLLCFVFLQNLTTQTEPRKSKISSQFTEDQRTEKSTFSDLKHHAFSAQRQQVESFKTATYAIDLHRNASARICEKDPCSPPSSWVFQT